MEFWETFILHAALGIVSSLPLKPEIAAKLETQMLLIRDSINAAYPGK